MSKYLSRMPIIWHECIKWYAIVETELKLKSGGMCPHLILIDSRVNEGAHKLLAVIHSEWIYSLLFIMYWIVRILRWEDIDKRNRWLQSNAETKPYVVLVRKAQLGISHMTSKLFSNEL